MMRRACAALFAGFLGLASAPGRASDIAETTLMRAATDLGQRYDANYAAKDPAAMAALFATDGVLVSLAGPIVRGREALVAYYQKRFESGAFGHHIKVLEVHVQGDGGYGVLQFSVTAPQADGALREENGHIVAIYQHGSDGWYLRLVEPSVTTHPK